MNGEFVSQCSPDRMQLCSMTAKIFSLACRLKIYLGDISWKYFLEALNLEAEKKMEVTSPLCYSDLRFNNAALQ